MWVDKTNTQQQLPGPGIKDSTRIVTLAGRQAARNCSLPGLGPPPWITFPAALTRARSSHPGQGKDQVRSISAKLRLFVVHGGFPWLNLLAGWCSPVGESWRLAAGVAGPPAVGFPRNWVTMVWPGGREGGKESGERGVARGRHGSPRFTRRAADGPGAGTPGVGDRAASAARDPGSKLPHAPRGPRNLKKRRTLLWQRSGSSRHFHGLTLAVQSLPHALQLVLRLGRRVQGRGRVWAHDGCRFLRACPAASHPLFPHARTWRAAQMMSSMEPLACKKMTLTEDACPMRCARSAGHGWGQVAAPSAPCVPIKAPRSRRGPLLPTSARADRARHRASASGCTRGGAGKENHMPATRRALRPRTLGLDDLSGCPRHLRKHHG